MRGPSAPRSDPEVRQPLALLPGRPSSSRDFKVFSGVRSRHVWFCQAGRKPSSHCLSVRPQAWGHLALLKVTGQQLKRLANSREVGRQLPAPAQGSGYSGSGRFGRPLLPLCVCVWWRKLDFMPSET